MEIVVALYKTEVERLQNGDNPVKAMLHEAIFLATCNAMMMTEKHCKLQRGCHTFAIFSRRTRSDWLIVSKLRCKLQRRCYTQATCLATSWKVEDSSTSLATRNATIAVAKWGVTRQIFLATCNATFVALQVARKIASCNMAFSACCHFFVVKHICRISYKDTWQTE